MSTLTIENLDHERCFICESVVSSGDVVEVKARGLKTFINASEKRKDGKSIHLARLEFVKVHEHCRETYAYEKSIKADLKKRREPTIEPEANEPEPAIAPFDFVNKCLFCAENITADFLKAEKKNHKGNVFKFTKSAMPMPREESSRQLKIIKMNGVNRLLCQQAIKFSILN